VRTVRLVSGARDQARALFVLMANVFEEPGAELTDVYVDRLLARQDFWAVAAVVGDEIVGGLTAHTLPMTKSESSEIFIFDVAVRPDHQRTGVGRLLLATLREEGARQGIVQVFVAVDDEDLHALDFYRALGGAASPVTMFTFPKSTRSPPLPHDDLG
jgi:aminoglycoside 3-N-acetyltransferase I